MLWFMRDFIITQIKEDTCIDNISAHFCLLEGRCWVTVALYHRDRSYTRDLIVDVLIKATSSLIISLTGYFNSVSRLFTLERGL